MHGLSLVVNYQVAWKLQANIYFFILVLDKLEMFIYLAKYVDNSVWEEVIQMV
jgi:hypothetical protein